MSGTVGQNNLREDMQQGVVDKTPYPDSQNLVESSERLRAADVIQPFERARTTEIKNLAEFYVLFGKVLEVAREYDGREYPIRFTKEYPPMDTELPTFAVKLISRRPLALKGTREMGFRPMPDQADPDFPGDILHTELRRQENIIQLTCWARTNKVADELADWVEDKFFEYLWAFQWAGIAHPVHWLDRGEDVYREEREQQMYGAPLTFSVITGKMVYRRATALRKLAVSLGILQEGD